MINELEFMYFKLHMTLKINGGYIKHIKTNKIHKNS